MRDTLFASKSRDALISSSSCVLESTDIRDVGMSLKDRDDSDCRMEDKTSFRGGGPMLDREEIVSGGLTDDCELILLDPEGLSLGASCSLKSSGPDLLLLVSDLEAFRAADFDWGIS